MIEVRKANEIHEEEGGWFHARWHFSFDQYRDPNQMGIGPLRVFNHDRLAPGAVWPLHPHRDVEGITFVVKGLFKHEDSMGNGGTLSRGGVQLMTLGSGALHSEQNGSESEPMEFIQLWILPDTANLTPSVQQQQFTVGDRQDRLLRVIGSGADAPIKVHQDASVYISSLSTGTSLSHEFASGRGGYLYLIEGALDVNGNAIESGDAIKVAGQQLLQITARAEGTFLLVDVPLQFEPVGVWAA